MKLFMHLLFLFAGLLLASCTAPQKQVTDSEDYNKYLGSDVEGMMTYWQQEQVFWSGKWQKTPNQFPYLGKLAGIESAMFEMTGQIDHLKNAEQYLVSVNTRTNYNNAGYLRTLARNLISQHRFKEALKMLERAEHNGEKLADTQKMLFDVHLELGNPEEALKYLTLLRKENDFDYLIRQAKWLDHQGMLSNAINYMEQASVIAEKSNNKGLMQWVYTNLADFYGHNNRINDSYQHYLKALAINPNDSYAKKGIAWIVYSYEKNPEEALRILNVISENHDTPDYYLLKADIAEYTNNKTLKEENLETYLAMVANDQYGDMYNKYNTLLYADDLNMPAKAMEIALREVRQRPTPQSYDLLAWCYFKNGDAKEALKIVQQNISGKTFEPEIQYHMALIYKANGMGEAAMKIKTELLESIYELGPLMEHQINML